MHYIVGDVQACYEPLQRLLDQVGFNEKQDHLCLCGDLIGRGPEPLAVLRFLMSLPHAAVVLGNHDIFLLMLLLGAEIEEPAPDDLLPVLSAPDREEIAQWLLSQPLVRLIDQRIVLVHAGIPPQWSIAEALNINILWQRTVASSDDVVALLLSLWGNHYQYNKDASLPERLAYAVNAFTRMRFCTSDGWLDFKYKHQHCDLPGYLPWFQWRSGDYLPIVFGHWSALKTLKGPNVIGLDTGCVWGGCLTAYCVETDCFYHENP